jgi:hypothetical protein
MSFRSTADGFFTVGHFTVGRNFGQKKNGRSIDYFFSAVARPKFGSTAISVDPVVVESPH